MSSYLVTVVRKTRDVHEVDPGDRPDLIGALLDAVHDGDPVQSDLVELHVVEVHLGRLERRPSW